MRNHTFTEGERVQIISSGSHGHRAAGVGTVGKVYKTGNFRLVGREGQWRSDGSEAGERGIWSSYYLVPHGSETAVRIRAGAKRRQMGRDIEAQAEEIRKEAERIPIVAMRRIQQQMKLALAAAEEAE